MPVSYHLDHPGPMARRVADLEIMLEPLPPLGQASRLPTGVRTTSRPAAETSDASPPPRLGLVEQFFMERGRRGRFARRPRRRWRGSRDAGPRSSRSPLGEDFDEVLAMHRRIMAVEAAAYHRQQFAAHRESYGPMITGAAGRGAGDLRRRLRRRHWPGSGRSAAASAELFARRRRADHAGHRHDGPATLDTTGTPRRSRPPGAAPGVPVVSIPCGLAADGMPAAVQLVGRITRTRAARVADGASGARLESAAVGMRSPVR